MGLLGNILSFIKGDDTRAAERERVDWFDEGAGSTSGADGYYQGVPSVSDAPAPSDAVQHTAERWDGSSSTSESS
jgi:hypothetical protein